METFIPGKIGVCAGAMMLKWPLLNQHVHNHPLKLQPGDHINVFINFETVLRNLAMQRGLTDLVVSHKQKVVIELESAIMNLMGSYRSYFKKEKCIPKMFFYSNELVPNTQQMRAVNPDYRTFFYNKYIQDPHFSKMGELMRDVIIPEVKLILSYVPDCYFITSKTFESSLIPEIISKDDGSVKNVIITGDIFDTLYMFDPNFMVIYINRRFHYFTVSSDIPSVVQSLVKDESIFDLTVFNSEMYFKILLAVKGSKIRNIKTTRMFGYGKLMRVLKDGIDNGIILRDFQAIDSIIGAFPTNVREDLKTAVQCTSIDTQYALLSDTDIEEIKSQIIDRIDMKSLEALNNKRFLESPINLPALLGD